MYLDQANQGNLPKYQCLQASNELETVIKEMPLNVRDKIRGHAESLGHPIKWDEKTADRTTLSIADFEHEDIADAVSFLYQVAFAMMVTRDSKESSQLSTPDYVRACVEGIAIQAKMSQLAQIFAKSFTTPPEKKRPHLKIVK